MSSDQELSLDTTRPPRWLSNLSLKRIVVIWIVTRIAGMVYISLYPEVAGDVGIYAGWASRFQRGQLPYVDFHVEYPPGILLLLMLPSPRVTVYRHLFFAVALATDAMVLRLLLRTPRRLGALVWLGAPTALGAVFWSRLDIFVALAFIVAIHAMHKQRFGLAAVAIVGAASLKLWPLAVLPMLWRWVTPARRLRYATSAALALAIAVVPLLAVGAGSGLRWMLDYHRGRGIAPESLPAVVMHIARLTGHGPRIVSGHGAVEFEPSAWPVFTRIADVLLVAGLLALLFYATKQRRALTPAHVLLLAITIVLCLSKVLSPQYTVWVAAVVAMLVDDLEQERDARALLLATFALLVATQYLWPIALPELIDGSAIGLVVGGVHALAVGVFAVVVVRCCVPRQHAAASEPDLAAEHCPAQ
jgi:hypothetical protein